MNFPFNVIATTAFDLLENNISRPEGDLARIDREEGSDYVGTWVLGRCRIGVHFPKSTTRELTAQEINHYSQLKVAVNNGYPVPILVST